jgi:uncharacterized protein with PQ loop repeat
MTPHPYREFIEQQAKRAEDDLAAFRDRAISVVTTSAGVVTLLTGLTAFASSKTKNEAGLPTSGVIFIGLSLACFLIASGLALIAQQSGKVITPTEEDMLNRTDPTVWYGKDDKGEPDTLDQERVVAKLTAEYASSVDRVAQQIAGYVDSAVGFQIVALVFSSVAALIFLVRK